MKASTSRNAVDVEDTEFDADGKSPDEEKLERINGEHCDQDVAEVKLDELKKEEGFQSYKDVAKCFEEPKEVQDIKKWQSRRSRIMENFAHCGKF